MTIVTKDVGFSTDKSCLWEWRKMSREIILINIMTVLFVVWFVLATREDILVVNNHLNRTSVMDIRRDPAMLYENGLNGTYNHRLDPFLLNQVLRKNPKEEGTVRRARKKSQRRRLNDRALHEKAGQNTIKFTPTIIDPPLYPTLRSGNGTTPRKEHNKNWFTLNPLLDYSGKENTHTSTYTFRSLGKSLMRDNEGDDDEELEEKTILEDYYFDYFSPILFPSAFKRAWRKGRNAMLELEELTGDIQDDFKFN